MPKPYRNSYEEMIEKLQEMLTLVEEKLSPKPVKADVFTTAEILGLRNANKGDKNEFTSLQGKPVISTASNKK